MRLANEANRRYAAAVKCILTLVLLVPALAACGTRPYRGEEGAPKAVVLCPPELRDAGQAVARGLQKSDYDVVLKVTAIPRERSALAVYGIHDNPDRLGAMKRFADDLGADVEFLPFQQHATGGNTVVIWLAPATTSATDANLPQSREAISPATSR